MATELRKEGKNAIAEIRRLVNDLRPPALDELGLLGALREHAGRLGRDMVMAIEADALPTLPAAVEVAAYRIATEAMTNVARHSGAHVCARLRGRFRLGPLGVRAPVVVGSIVTIPLGSRVRCWPSWPRVVLLVGACLPERRSRRDPTAD